MYALFWVPLGVKMAAARSSDQVAGREDDWIYVGNHASRIDSERETFITVFHGALTLEEHDRMDVLVRTALREKRVRFYILDVSDLPNVSPDVRRRMGANADPTEPEATIIIGAGSAMRILANLVRRGLELLGRQQASAFLFCRDLAEAHAWIAARRGAQ